MLNACPNASAALLPSAPIAAAPTPDLPSSVMSFMSESIILAFTALTAAAKVSLAFIMWDPSRAIHAILGGGPAG